MRYVLLVVLIAAVLVLLLFTTKEKKKEVETGLKALDQATLFAAESGFNSIRTALEGYQAEQGQYPDTLIALVPQYLSSPAALNDPWGTPIKMEAPSSHSITLVSAGPDRAFDTADDIRRKIL